MEKGVLSTSGFSKTITRYLLDTSVAIYVSESTFIKTETTINNAAYLSTRHA